MANSRAGRNRIPALKVHQWLKDWNEIAWKPDEKRSEPQHWFYQFSMSASDLKKLSGVYARSTDRRRGGDDLGVQRRHESERSDEIKRFVRFGYPWSDLSETKRNSGEFDDLRQPGWLPTAVVVNILSESDTRINKRVDPNDLVTVDEHDESRPEIKLPDSFQSGEKWDYTSIPPIEIIDGQHRLWAFEDFDLEGDFELPVVAFHGLDLSWQAYLFYSINIKPKKINASLAFDLYPLLRTEEWLTRFEGHVIYRETRAQEIVDLLWSHSESPWYHRINMLGERGYKGLMATQAAWVRSLLAAIIKSWEGRGVSIGGIFGASIGANDTVLPWSKSEQAAFIMTAGLHLKTSIERGSYDWAESLRSDAERKKSLGQKDPAYFGPNTLLNQDQGVRTFLHVLNDITYVLADDLGLFDVGGRYNLDESEEWQVNEALKSIEEATTLNSFLRDLGEKLASFDWRASSAPDLSDDERTQKAAFRGSGGYKELRRHVLHHLVKQDGTIAEAASHVITALGYE